MIKVYCKDYNSEYGEYDSEYNTLAEAQEYATDILDEGETEYVWIVDGDTKEVLLEGDVYDFDALAED